MSRIGRIIIPEVPYHVTQRGNNRQKIFFETKDYQIYLSFLKKYASRYKLQIYCYCIMPNHIHLIAYPTEETSLTNTVSRTNMMYTRYRNELDARSGHLWQGRFYSCAMESVHLYRAANYVENNPVRCGLVKTPDQWPWSSALKHLSGKLDVLETDAKWPDEETIADWPAILNMKQETETLDALKRATESGRPYASEEWINNQELVIGKKFPRSGPGRPKS